PSCFSRRAVFSRPLSGLAVDLMSNEKRDSRPLLSTGGKGKEFTCTPIRHHHYNPLFSRRTSCSQAIARAADRFPQLSILSWKETMPSFGPGTRRESSSGFATIQRLRLPRQPCVVA